MRLVISDKLNKTIENVPPKSIQMMQGASVEEVPLYSGA